MRRSIIRLLVTLAVLTGGTAVFSRSMTTSLSEAVAGKIAGPTVDRPMPARAAPGKAIRLARQAHPRICKVLTEPTSIEFVEAPLQDVVDYLKDLHNLEIQLDTKVLEDASIGADTPVTCNVKGVSLGAALDLVLNRLDLTYVVDGEVLLITAENSDPPRLVVQLYDCAWAKPNQLTDLIAVVGLIDAGGALAAPAAQKSEADASRPAQTAPGFKVVPYGSRLVVRATAVEHETVRRLLAELRTAAESETAAATAKEKVADPAETKP